MPKETYPIHIHREDQKDAFLPLLEDMLGTFCDWCSVNLIDENKMIVRSAYGAIDAEKDRTLNELETRFPIAWNLAQSITKVMKSHASVLFDVIDETFLKNSENGVTDPYYAKLLQALKPTSLLVVPILEQDRILGVIIFGQSRDHSNFNTSHITQGELISKAFGLAINNMKLKNEIMEIVRTKADFLSVVTHELKTPISVLKTRLDSLRAPLKQQLTNLSTWFHADSSLELSCKELDQFTSLIETLFEVSNLNASNLILEELDLVDLIRSTITNLERNGLCPKGQIQFIDSHEIMGRWDQTLLKQMICNLLLNSVQHGLSTPLIAQLAEDADRVKIQIQYQSAGISERHKQINPTCPITGPGLGLYIVCQILKVHGGTLSMESIEGKGSIFLVDLPLKT